MKSKSFKDKIIFKKYLIKKLISSSAFSNVYEGINQINKTPVALKIEKNDGLKFLENEAYFLMYLKGFGIPKIISYGKSGIYNILIEELLGSNMEFLWKKNFFSKKNKTLKDVCMFALQGLERLKFIHDKHVVHRDIKHKNFIIGKNDPYNIYLIDFGFSRKYRSSRTGKHIKFVNKQILIGSICYSSSSAIRGYEISRRDDLESFGYVLLYFAKGRWLPWLRYEYQNMKRSELIIKVREMKLAMNEEILCEGLPYEFVLYLKYVKNLKFEEEPDYKYLYGLFISILTKQTMKNDLNFFWIKKTKPKIIQRDKQTDNVYNTSSSLKNFKVLSRSVSSRKRLFDRIKDSLDKKRIKNVISPENIFNYNKNISVVSSLKKRNNYKNDIPHYLTFNNLINNTNDNLIKGDNNESKIKIKQNKSFMRFPNEAININIIENKTPINKLNSKCNYLSKFQEIYSRYKRNKIFYVPKTINKTHIISNKNDSKFNKRFSKNLNYIGLSFIKNK